MKSSILIQEGGKYQLEIMGNKGYVAVWQSSDDSVVQVDKNGCLKGIRSGKATITAKIGTTTLKCIVTVVDTWTGWF
jgi:uncharacterized protein YjdB